MRPPATSRGARALRDAPTPRAGEIKVTRNSKRQQIKASRGSGKGAPRRRKVAEPRRSQTAADRRVAETRRRSLSSYSGSRPGPARPRPQRASQPPATRVVAVGGSAAAATARVVSEVAKPVSAAARPMLRVVSGGLDRLPTASAAPLARGRVMILIAGLLAAGLIYINVGKLEYGDGYGNYTQRVTELQRQNTALRASIARRSTPERIQRYAQRMGMVSPVPEQFDYLRTKRGDSVRAAKGYSAPTPVVVSEPAAPATPEAPTAQAPPAAPAEAPPPVATPQPAAPAAGAPTAAPGVAR